MKKLRNLKIKTFDVAINDEGTFTDFKINVAGATETIDVLANGVEGAVDQLKKLSPELKRVADAQQNLNDQQQLGNSLRASLGADRSTTFGERSNIIDDLKRLIGIKPQIEEARANVKKWKDTIDYFEKSLVYRKTLSEYNIILITYTEEYVKQTRASINKLKNKLAVETLRVNDIPDQASQEVITALSKELNFSEKNFPNYPI